MTLLMTYAIYKVVTINDRPCEIGAICLLQRRSYHFREVLSNLELSSSFEEVQVQKLDDRGVSDCLIRKDSEIRRNLKQDNVDEQTSTRLHPRLFVIESGIGSLLLPECPYLAVNKVLATFAVSKLLGPNCIPFFDFVKSNGWKASSPTTSPPTVNAFSPLPLDGFSEIHV